jgi:hypothetical protein
MATKKVYLSITIVLTTAITVTLTGFAHFGAAQGQEDGTTAPSSSLTPEQKAAICDPNNPESNLNPVNTTESKICGIPKTVKPHISNTTSATTPDTTGAEASPPPDTSIAPEDG